MDPAASQRMQFVALKYEIEQMRLHPSIVGYVITEFTDVHWECNGLLDMCRNPKIFHDQLGNLNADDVIVPEIERAAVWAGERCAVRLSLSHFSHRDLAGARLAWQLDHWPEIGGVFTRDAQAMVRSLAGIDIVGADVVEVSPPFDVGGMTALAGATMMFELLCVMAGSLTARAA